MAWMQAVVVLWLVTWPASDLQRQLQALVSPLPHSQVQIGACVVRLPDEQVVFAHHADLPLIPASCQKVIAGALALDALGAAYQFETRLVRHGDDIVVLGGGDPGLGDARLAKARQQEALTVFRKWAAALKGLDLPAGRLLIDDSLYEDTRTHPSWEPVDLPKWFAAPVGGLNFNDNCVEFTISPTRPGEPVRWTVFPPNSWVQVSNRCTTGRKKAWIHRPPDSAVYELRGRCAKSQDLQPVSVTDPGLFAGEVLRAVLLEAGLPFDAPVERVQLSQRPGDAEVLQRHVTPISAVLTRALRDSQNLFAECLLKSSAQQADRRNGGAAPATWKHAAQWAPGALREWGVQTAGLVVADGSGLSRDNRVTARQLVGVLQHAYARLPAAAGDQFIAALSEAGKNGTMRKRMKNFPGTVYGKTGYMRGIRSLCGFVVPESGESWYAFAVMFNDIPGGTAPYNAIHEKICKTLATAGAR